MIRQFICPKNVYSIPDADGIGEVGDAACGDALTFYINVEEGRLKEVSYMVFGCVASIATSSMTSILAKGKTIEEALEITEEDVIVALDGLPEEKVHCSNLGISALRKAIQNYYEKQSENQPTQGGY